jgi:hypothetical protein
MRPDREWSLGDARGKTGKRWESHGWVVQTTVRSEDSGGRPASELIPIALDRFEARVKAFAKSASLLGDSTPRYVVLGILAEEVPGIELGRSFLRLLAGSWRDFAGRSQCPSSHCLGRVHCHTVVSEYRKLHGTEDPLAPLPGQRPLQFGIFEQRHFVSFAELQGTFERAADVVGAGSHVEIEGDGIETIDKRFSAERDSLSSHARVGTVMSVPNGNSGENFRICDHAYHSSATGRPGSWVEEARVPGPPSETTRSSKGKWLRGPKVPAEIVKFA